MKKDVVIDSNVVASWLLPDEKDDKSLVLLDHLSELKLNVPAIFVYEMMNILLMAERRKRITSHDVDRILVSIDRLPLIVDEINPHYWAYNNIVSFAKAHNLTVYDAAYFELSARLGGVPLLTNDKEMISVSKKIKIQNTYEEKKYKIT